jgi:hypothetical protein
MSTFSKSPVRVARRALAAGKAALRDYAQTHSPKKFTQPQLFACLVLKVFSKNDYRGMAQLLADLSDLRRALGLRCAPHWTTLHKAAGRLLQRRRVRRLLTSTVRRVLGRRRRVQRAALDSTGFETGHTSHYYARRRAKRATPKEKVRYSRYAKLEAAFDCTTHLVLGAIPRRGPAVDTDRFVPLLDEALRQVKISAALADAGYDAEGNHRHAREKRGVKSFMPATAGRPTTKLPTGRYRRQMKQRLDKAYGRYGQRWQAETGFSVVKRRLGSAVHGRSYQSQCRELLLFVLTYNLMIN